MSAYTIITIIIILAAVAGWIFKVNGELAGLGRKVTRGSFCSPHGSLVRTKRLDATEELPVFTRFGIMLAIGVGVTALLFLLSYFGLFSWGGAALLVVHFIVLMALCVGVAHSDAGIWRPLAYALFGYVLLAIIPSALWVYEITPVAQLSFGDVNMLTCAFGALGAAVAVTLMPSLYSYAREFEDGHVNAIQVSSRSVARKAYDSVCDPTWKPPADRIADFKATQDIRSYMEKR